MGTTIRRKPIESKIPANPNYYFQNILNFGGINISSNPFETDPNTASDCLNVYVDEDNSLSTRPRLELEYDLTSMLPEGYSVNCIWNIHNGYIAYVTENGSHPVSYGSSLFYVFVKNGNSLNSFRVLMNGFFRTDHEHDVRVVFEQNDKIYIMEHDIDADSSHYWYIKYTNIDYTEEKAYILFDVDYYVPTILTGLHRWVSKESRYDDIGVDYESLNILSDTYKKSYFWDGTWSYAKLSGLSEKTVNDYVKSKNVSLSNLPDNVGLLKYLYTASENSPDYNYYFAQEVLTDPIGPRYTYPCVVTTDKFNNYLSISYCRDGSGSKVYLPNTDRISQNIFDCSADAKYIAWIADVRESVSGNIYHTVISYTRFDLTSEFNINTALTARADSSNYDVNGTGLLLYDEYSGICLFKSKNTSNKDRLIRWGANSSAFDVSSQSNKVLYWCASYNSNVIYYCAENNGTDETYRLSKIDIVNGTYTDYTNKILKSGEHIIPNMFLYMDTDKFGNTLFVRASIQDSFGAEKIQAKIFHDLTEDGVVIDNATHVRCKVSEEGDRLFYWSDRTLYQNYNIGGWFVNFESIETLEQIRDLELGLLSNEHEGYYSNNKIINIPFADGVGVNITTFDFDNIEPLLTIEFDIKTLDEDTFNKISDLRNKFLNSNIHTRFDNDYWFSSNNHTFHTLYNDPTYIPLSEYNELGSNYSEINAFNQIGDTTLMAYKKDQLYIITPTVVGDTRTYTYTETKSVEGNYALNAPIVTVLKEYPTFVNNNGIFVLKQLSDVQSSDRIAELLSEPMNAKWLNETNESKEHCITFNRLYWTYYVLSAEGDDGPYTKVYLLDNRTTQWYYWELPIDLLTCFNKDDTAIFVDKKGNIYRLTTTDIINTYNPDLTEYYDYGEKLIKWFWKSQILPLKTINYQKKLVDTTFILTDTDAKDNYGLNYKFIAYRKNASVTAETTISDNLNYVQSTTKRTMIPRFNFLQVVLSNVEDENQLDQNKLRLVGLALKYVLLNYGT